MFSSLSLPSIASVVVALLVSACVSAPAKLVPNVALVAPQTGDSVSNAALSTLAASSYRSYTSALGVACRVAYDGANRLIQRECLHDDRWRIVPAIGPEEPVE